jgi:hypothetical protein
LDGAGKGEQRSLAGFQQAALENQRIAGAHDFAVAFDQLAGCFELFAKPIIFAGRMVSPRSTHPCAEMAVDGGRCERKSASPERTSPDVLHMFLPDSAGGLRTAKVEDT